MCSVWQNKKIKFSAESFLIGHWYLHACWTYILRTKKSCWWKVFIATHTFGGRCWLYEWISKNINHWWMYSLYLQVYKIFVMTLKVSFYSCLLHVQISPFCFCRVLNLLSCSVLNCHKIKTTNAKNKLKINMRLLDGALVLKSGETPCNPIFCCVKYLEAAREYF